MATKAPTLEELLDALGVAETADSEGRTTAEWQEVWGVGYARAIKLIKAALTQGRMTVGYQMRENPMRPGWRAKYTVYQWVQKGKKK